MRNLVSLLGVLLLGSAGCSETPGAGSGGTGGARFCSYVSQCDDGEPCTLDLCVSNACQNVPRSCDDYADCTTDSCDPEVGCQNDAVMDGAPCAGGLCRAGVCALEGTELPCVEQAIRNAIAAGGGPYTFSCDGPTAVVTEASIIIDNDVVLDGEGNLIVDGNGQHRVFLVNEGVTVELTGIEVTRGSAFYAAGIWNRGTLTVHRSVISNNITHPECMSGGGGFGGATCPEGGGILNWGRLSLVESTVESNASMRGGGILNAEELLLLNSTVSENTSEGIFNFDVATVLYSTLSGNTVSAIDQSSRAETTLFGTIVNGVCDGPGVSSSGYNIESPGNTCRFDGQTDRANVSPDDLKLGPLLDNGGPTKTRALDAGSAAIDSIPFESCVDADGQPLAIDQRGLPRPGGEACDVGAFEVQP